MIKSVFFYLLIPALVATSFMTGYTWHKAGTEIELSDVIDWNTKQIHSLGVNSAVEKQNAELLIQILNVLEGNEVKSVSKAIPLGMMNSDEPIEDDDVPHTFEQVNKDQREVDRGIRAAASNNLFQNETLHNILEKLKGSII
jgi:hypothetical protein